MNQPSRPSSLSDRQRREVREVVRRIWVEVGGDLDRAVDLARERLARKIGQNFLRQSEQLGRDLVRHWADRGVDEPEAVFVAGEPGCRDEDE